MYTLRDYSEEGLRDHTISLSYETEPYARHPGNAGSELRTAIVGGSVSALNGAGLASQDPLPRGGSAAEVSVENSGSGIRVTTETTVSESREPSRNMSKERLARTRHDMT